MIRFIVAALLGCFALPVSSATLERLTLDDMTTRSTAIVRGRVVSSSTAARGPIIYTHYRIQVTERWKGAEAQMLDVVVPGGAAGAMRQSFSGAPLLANGSDYVLFLWQSRSGLTHIIGLSQGLFTVKPDSKGTLTALRPAATEPLLDASGKLVRSESLSMPLQGLRDQVQRTMAGGANQ